VNLSLCPTNEYRISFNYQVLKPFPTSYIQVGVIYPDAQSHDDYASLGQVEALANATTNGWQHASGLFNDTAAPRDVIVDITLGIEQSPPQNTPGPVILVDNVAVEPVKSLIAPGCPHAPAPLTNNRFQSGQLAPWEIVFDDPSSTNYSVVAGSHGDAQTHALRLQYLQNATGVQVTLAYPVGSVCLGFVYVFEFEYNVIQPMPPPSADGQNSYNIIMPRCQGVNATKQFTFPNVPLLFSVTGRGSITNMCRMRHNDAALYKIYLETNYPGTGAVVDILGVTARLATAADFGDPS
jgi:hypothetical protein